MTEKITICDDLGDELVLSGQPRRIVSLVPSVSETIIELGAKNFLVGITNYCVHPAAVVASVDKVGGTKGFSFDKIAALEPDLILANKEENRKHHIDELRKKYPVFVTYPRTVEDAVKMILDLGILTGQSSRASEMASACDHLLDSMDPAVAGPPIPTVCMIWRDPWMVAGYDTYLNELLERVGFANVFAPEDGRYPETTLETIREHHPRVIFLPNEPYEFGPTDKSEVDEFFEGDGIETLLADGSLLTWFGSRTLKGLAFLYNAKIKLMRT